jgi:hypothetical protein
MFGNNTPIKNNIIFMMLGVMLCAVISISGNCQEVEMKDTCTQNNPAFEKLLQKLGDAYPWSVDKLEKVLGVRLAPKTNQFNEYIISYGANDVAYADELLVSEVELRLKKETGDFILLILRIDKNTTCITREKIKHIYPDLVLTSVPSGHSWEEEARFSAKQVWGRLSFGFKENRPNCLYSIAFIQNEN